MEKIPTVETFHSEKDRKPYKFPGLEVVDEKILTLMEKELNLPFWRNLEMEGRQDIINNGDDLMPEDFYTISHKKFMVYNILNIMHYDPWNRRPSKGMKAVAIFNMDSGKWTSKSPIKTELSEKLKKLISKVPKIINSQTDELEKN